MRKGVLQELIKNSKQDKKYIYQRYNGIITKYIDDGKYYIDCESGIGIKKDEHLMLGKVSENIIDLVEKNDIVNGYKVIKIKDGFAEGAMEIVLANNTIIYRHHTREIKTILTHESYETNCYKVGGEDGI